MKILIYGINYAPEITGIGKYSGEMTEWLAAKGHELRVICAPPYYPEWQVAESYRGWRYINERLNGVDVIRCPLFVPKVPRARSRLLHLLSFAVTSLPVLIKQFWFKPDVVLVVEPTFFCVPATVLFSKLSGAKSILHVQDFELDAMLGLGMAQQNWISRFFYAVESAFMCQFNAISTISKAMSARALQKSKNLLPVHFLPNWVDIDFIRPDVAVSLNRQQWNIPENAQVVVYSGSLGKKQGLNLLIEVAQIFRDQNIIFLIFGDGVEKQALIEQANQLNLKNIRFDSLLPYEDLPALMLLADVHIVIQKRGVADLVMPSKLTTILSAGSYALITAEPDTELGLLCKQYPGIAECIPPENLEMFVEVLGKMLAEAKSGRPKINSVARKYALENLNKEFVLENFENVLLELSVEENSKFRFQT